MPNILKTKKPQQDRLLKRLNAKDRKEQEQLRRLIGQDRIFDVI